MDYDNNNKKKALSIQIIILRKTIVSFYKLKIYLPRNKQVCRLLYLVQLIYYS